MFRTVPLSIIRSFSQCTQQWFADSWQLASRIRTFHPDPARKLPPVWHIPLLCVQWKTPDDVQRNCPKHVDFFPQNKFEILVHLVGFFLIRIHWGVPSHVCVILCLIMVQLLEHTLWPFWGDSFEDNILSVKRINCSFQARHPRCVFSK